MIQTPKFVTRLFPKQIWEYSNIKNTIYLTFDDGPIAEVTPWVLDQLADYQAKATFFCIGDNVVKHPAIFSKIVAASHGIGNHSYSHCNGWKTSLKEYVIDVEKCETVLRDHLPGFVPLFRPPYGRITPKQVSVLKTRGYQIVMWSILSKDYEQKISKQQCLENVLQHIKPGSIVVFHDSLKAFKNLQYTLPKVLEHCTKKGWQCQALPLPGDRPNEFKI